MKIFHFLCLTLLAPATFAQTDSSAFMTTRDILRHDAGSNINLHNNRSAAATVYGLYVRQYSYVTPGSTCASATTIYTGNITGGSFVAPVTISANKSVSLGGNFLYNMILGAIYYENIIIPSSPPGCALPGCTWGTDSTKYNWCIYLGALAPVANSSTYTSTIPPATENASGSGYNYNVISSYVNLGPISCSDQTLSCTAATSQTQSFS